MGDGTRWWTEEQNYGGTIYKMGIRKSQEHNNTPCFRELKLFLRLRTS
jgi:hypothetical protein